MKLSSAKFLVSLSLLALAASPILAAKPKNPIPSSVSAQTIQTSPTPKPSATPNPGKVQSCLAKQTAIQTRMNSLTRLANNMLGVFADIAQRVESFYTAKVLPTGKTVTNYATLTADIQTKQTAVQTALTKAQTDANSFSCESVNPKTQINQFRTDMQAVKTALKNYRTSIRNLIVAVRGAAVKALPSVSPSPKVVVSPTASPTSTP